MIARIISVIGGIITSLLALRFVFMLLGANNTNAIVNFVYSASYPFVAPFFGMFSYQPQFGVSRFEFETLIAMLFWGLVTGLLVRLFGGYGRRSDI